MKLPKFPRLTAADKAFNRQYAAFKRRLAQAKLQDVVGVVKASGAGCIGEPPDCSLVFSFAAWRLDGSPVRTDDMHVEMPASQKRALQHMAAIAAYDIVRARARVAQTPRGSMSAKAVRVVATHVVDDELKSHADRLQQPVTVRDSRLGEFALDRSMGQFEGKCRWGGREVPLVLDLDEAGPERVGELLATAHALRKSEKAWRAHLARLVLKEALPLYNDGWRQDGDPRLSPAAFLRKIKVGSITVGVRGGFEFTLYQECDLFGDHFLTVRGSLSEGLRVLKLEG